MNNDDFLEKARQRRADRPDIHFAVNLTRGGGSKNAAAIAAVSEMVSDLRDAVPELSMRQLSALIGVSDRVVREAADQIEPKESWSSDNNEMESAAEFSRLTLLHPDRQYVDHPDAEFECSAVPFLFTAPQPIDHHRCADQSHTVKRPITLPTFPFLPLPERYAA
jgi:hypothetical protein